ncbi:MAG: A/G-specific adenine glycosylase [Lachnospiraceae bacterium]|nr:A/G-specific adenine glycosylase [Lachnospiraceae bacterium]
MNKKAEISERLISWYRENARDLPWREAPSPYRVWISEIMLQQTRIETVRGYFDRFMKAFPDIAALAAAEEDRVLKLWQGLGYYSRARNLHRAAQVVMDSYDGRMPSSYGELRKLPGIGPYTAGAIASIACGECVPAVDGNVLRVMARLLAETGDVTSEQIKKKLTAAVTELVPREGAGDFNQALMELGECICVPGGSPDCTSCPLYEICEARKQGLQDKLPVRTTKKARPVEELTVLILRFEDTFAVRKRPARGLLAGLYEYPNLPGHWTRERLAAWLPWQADPEQILPLEDSRHIFTHKEWKMKAYEIRPPYRWEDGWSYVSASELQDHYSVPTAFRIYTEWITQTARSAHE